MPAILAAIALFPSASVFAQDATPDESSTSTPASASTSAPASAPAAAQAASGQTLAPVVVTASRTAQSVTEALPHTTVVTQEDIVNSQAPDLRSLLRNQAGVEFSTNGGMGTNTSLFMRGANSN